MRFLPTRVHGVIDYLSVIALLATPHFIQGESSTVAMLFQAAGVAVLLISLLTRYELGAYRTLPMRAHLAIDFVMGIAFLVCAYLLGNDVPAVRNTFLAFGLLSICAALFTRSLSTVETPDTVERTA